jgi:hypothetical protein
MLYALNSITQEKISAIKGVPAVCPGCNGPVIARIGSVVIPHWAHQKNSNCAYSEGETEWHLDWKAKFPKENCEIRMENHRADVFINNVVLEFQSVTPDLEKIQAREGFYKEMYWIYKYHNKEIEISTFYKKTKILPMSEHPFHMNPEFFDAQYMNMLSNVYENTIFLKHGLPGWKNATKGIFLDLGSLNGTIGKYLFFVRSSNIKFKMLDGFFISYEDFINYIIKGEDWKILPEKWKLQEKSYLESLKPVPKLELATTKSPERSKTNFKLYDKLYNYQLDNNSLNDPIYVFTNDTELKNHDMVYAYFTDEWKIPKMHIEKIESCGVTRDTLQKLAHWGLILSPAEEYPPPYSGVENWQKNNDKLQTWLLSIDQPNKP